MAGVLESYVELLSHYIPRMGTSDAQSKKQQSKGKLREFWDSVRITLIVVGTALIGFVAARNTVTWHVQRFWGASGDYWQRRWDSVYDLFGGNEFALCVIGTTIVANIVFWGFNSFFLFLDCTGTPKALLRFKVQEEQNVPIDWTKLMKALRVCATNQLIVTPLFMIPSFYALKARGCTFDCDLPIFHWVILEVGVFTLVEEVFFYYSHRLLHHPRIYKHIHKIHHEWTASIGIIGVYAHPVEHILSNFTPVLAGPLLMGSHIGTAWIWLSLAIMTTSISHSGYHFPFLPSPEAHDFHHLKFTNNFGVLGILDRFHNTDNMFRESKQYQRHFLSIGLMPLRELIPEDQKQRNGKEMKHNIKECKAE